MSNDFANAVRGLRKSPTFALTAITTISLGVGASTAVFSVAEPVLLRPLPYSNPDRLVVVNGEMRRRNAADLPLSGPDFLDLRNTARTMFEDFAAVRTGRTLFPQADGTLEQVRFASVSPNFVRLLGGQTMIGRDFADADGVPLSTEESGVAEAQRASTAAILSYEYWQRRYGGGAAVLGQRLTTGGPQVVGVLRPGFELWFPPNLNLERSPDVWFAARLPHDQTQRAVFSHRVVGRLKDGVSLESARAEADGVAAQLRRVFPLWQTADFHLQLDPLHKYLVADVEPAILALMGAAICLLLIACANVANLLLVRTSLRERELAVRTALGGSRWRLIRQMLVEALVLAGMGTLLGMGLAWGGLRALLAIAPANLPRLDQVAISPVVLAFGGLLGLTAAAVFGAAPAVRGSRTDLISVLRAGGRPGASGGGRLLRKSVVVAEISLSFVLLVGSGLMLRSLIALQSINPGFDARGVLTFQVLGPGHDTPQHREAFMRDVRARLGAIPGVVTVTAASPFPLADRFYAIRWGTADALTDASKFQAVNYQVVLPGYFETLKARLIAGRVFTNADNAPERNVVIVDQVLASKAFPHESAVGKRILTRIRTPEPEWVEVIGVVAHQRSSSLAESGREQMYFTDGFVGHGAAARWAIRTAADPSSYDGAVRAALPNLGGQLVITELEPMEALVRRSQAGTRFSLLLLSVLASTAVLLAAVGIYGVLSTVVRQRTPEIGIRIAVGAAPWTIFKLILRQGLSLSAAGIGIGIAVALGVTSLIGSMLVSIEARDPVTFVAMSVLFFIIAATASWLPAHRAMHLNPTAALREE